MIEGLKFKIPGEELRNRLLERRTAIQKRLEGIILLDDTQRSTAKSSLQGLDYLIAHVVLDDDYLLTIPEMAGIQIVTSVADE